MKKSILIGLMLLYISAIAAAQEHTASQSDPGRTKPQPQRYISDAGRYSVLFPEEPKLSTQNMTMATGDRAVQYMAMSFNEGTLFMVGYFDYPAGVTFNLDKARDGMIESAKGTLLAEQAISLGGSPGKQVKFLGHTDDGTTDFINRVRFFDVTPRVFVLQCMVTKDADGAAAADKCESFFDSFKVTTR
jgi:hypothetical protein